MKTLMIVDDEDKICWFLSRFFDARGFHTVIANSGYAAIEKLHTEAPDYLILDLRMPDVSGFDILKLAKERYPNLNVVVVTACDDAETAKTAFRLGASDFVTKPFGMNEQTWARAFFTSDE